MTALEARRRARGLLERRWVALLAGDRRRRLELELELGELRLAALRELGLRPPGA